jgi:hypothetical protein
VSAPSCLTPLKTDIRAYDFEQIVWRPLEWPTSLRTDELGAPLLFAEAARFHSRLDLEAALAELTIIPAEMPDST